MNAVQARKVVLASIGIMAAVSLYKQHTGKAATQQGTYRTLWGVGVVGVLLSLLADFAPAIAGPFAILVALGSITHGGENLINDVLGKAAVSSSGTATTAAATSPPVPVTTFPAPKPVAPGVQTPAQTIFPGSGPAGP